MAIVIMVSPHVHCSIAMATMNFMLLVFPTLKNKSYGFGADAIGAALSSWKALGNWGVFLYSVRVKSFLLSGEHMEKDGALGKKNKNPKQRS